MKKSTHIGAKALEKKVARSYERKGMSKRKANYVAGAVAGKVYREQKAKKRRMK